MSSSRQARITRTAISPRLAIRIFFRAQTSRTTAAVGSAGIYACQGRGQPSRLRYTRTIILSERRWPSVVRCLFVRVGELEQTRFGPRAAEELQAGGQRVAARVSHRDGDCREAGARRE